MAKILLTIPTEGIIHPLTDAWTSRMAKRSDITHMNIIGRPVDYARNSAIRVLLEHPEFTHILFIDSDIEPPIDAIDRLVAPDAPLATGCYNVIGKQLEWALANKGNDGHYRLLKQLPDGDTLFTVDAGGAGCLLIRRDVFDIVKWPWFKWIENEDGSQIGEDIYFFAKCNVAGLRVVCDPAVWCNHYKTVNLRSLIRR